MSDTYEHVGHIYNNSHSATPLTIGDFQVMKGWKGNVDGNTNDEVIDIGTGKVFTCDLDLTGPNVFVKGDEIVLLAETDRMSLLDDYSLEDLQGAAGADWKNSYGTFEIDVPSGAVVINLSYNATPEEGSDTSGLSQFFKGLPFLPKAAPTKPYYPSDDNPDWQAHCIVPVTPGTYEVRTGTAPKIGEDGEDFMRVVIKRKS